MTSLNGHYDDLVVHQHEQHTEGTVEHPETVQGVRIDLVKKHDAIHRKSGVHNLGDRRGIHCCQSGSGSADGSG